MYFKKFNGNIFGVTLNKSEEKALQKEINRQILEQDKIHQDELDAMVLYTLHETFGFGKDRLRRFWEHMYQNYKEITAKYEMEDGFPFLCQEALKEIGVDVHEWNEELKKDLQ